MRHIQEEREKELVKKQQRDMEEVVKKEKELEEQRQKELVEVGGSAKLK